MECSRYTISQAAELLEVRESQLRYWEDELELRVHRNGQGHRYYTGYEIQMFHYIKDLKKQGMQLRAIREKIPQIAVKAPGSSESRIKLLTMQGRTDAKAEKEESFHRILVTLIEEEVARREAEEARFRALDQMIREYQNARREAALTFSGRKRK